MKRDSDIFKWAASSVKDLAVLSCVKPGKQATSALAKRCDGMADIVVGKHFIREPYIVRASLGPDTVHLLSMLRQESKEGLLLVASHVNDRIGSLLRSADVHFMDTDGNLFLDGSGIHMFVIGRRSNHKPLHSQRGSGSRAFFPSGLRLIYHLLIDPALNSGKAGSALVDGTYREISERTGISHSTVGWVMADLMDQKLVIQVSPGHRMLADRPRILERWVQGYIERLRPSLVVERYRPPRADWWQDAILSDGLWSGETAAALLTHVLKPQTSTIFGNRPSHDFVLKHLLQKDPEGTVAFLKPFWRTSQDPSGGVPCVHPLVVYADLLSIDDDRTREVAKHIYDKYLRTIIETA
ncbi:MAG: type IV toxin-antitoxin system AbiEi family antitoxin [bacterium]